MSASDFTKRKELLAELIYYIFDSFLILLVRSNFHVTESSAHRHRLFYFRHDVWSVMTKPTMSRLKAGMLEILPKATEPIHRRRVLASSTMRLVPKETGLRPIMNLSRRTETERNGTLRRVRSVNSALAPVYDVLNQQKVCLSLKTV